jgi:tRNA-splicing ligase RtcB
MAQSFGTCCHGAGRVMSRTQAVKHAQGRRIDEELAKKGVMDVDLVVDVVHRAGLARKVARMKPIGVVKG